MGATFKATGVSISGSCGFRKETEVFFAKMGKIEGLEELNDESNNIIMVNFGSFSKFIVENKYLQGFLSGI